MANGKVIVVAPEILPAMWDMFMARKPAGFEVTLVKHNEGEKKLASEVAGADYLVSLMGGRFPAAVLDAGRQLKLILTMGIGTDHLPVKYALEKKIPVTNNGGGNAITAAEHTLLLMLACLRRFTLFNLDVRAGTWRNWPVVGSLELYDTTVGIIGLGNIGRRVAKLCYAFGANIIYHERFLVPYAVRADYKAKPVSLEDLLRQSDIVTIHVPGIASNRKMFGWNELNQMKPTAYLINTSRGTNLDEAALIRALKEGKIAGAGLDVFDPEPPHPENPLLKMPNVVVTPHIAALCDQNLAREFETMWHNISLVSEGREPLHQVREF